jgi:transcriptional regulator with XRE-family HTH domain
MKPIFEFSDYRDFLKERFQMIKGEKRSTSLETVARKIGLSKPFLTLVLNKKRHMSLDSVAHLEAGFKLTPAEREYLIFLICFNVIADSSTKDFFAVVLRRLRALFELKSEAIDWQSFEEKFPFHAMSIPELILSLAELPEFHLDADWILSKINLKIPKELILAAMQEIEKKGGVEKILSSDTEVPMQIFHHPTKVSASKLAAATTHSLAQYLEVSDPLTSHSWVGGFLLLDEKSAIALHKAQNDFVQVVANLMKDSKEPVHIYSYFTSSMRVTKNRQGY